MQLISVLASGVIGAENGYATLKKRGTQNAATWYGTAEAGSSSAAQVTLDEYGAGVAYVDESVDVKAYSSEGILVRSFTQMLSASDIELISTAFTGTDYETAAVGASKPAVLQAVMDLWLTKSGATDWQVKVGGTTATLPVWLGMLTGLVYNVKSSTYGATGDGAADDTSAVQAAITAANAAGGGIVFFPKGTYKTTALLESYDTVWLVGVGAGASILRTAHATAPVVRYNSAGTATKRGVIAGLTIDSSVVNTGIHVQVVDTNKLAIWNCSIGGANSNGLGVATDAGTTATIDITECTFNTGTGLLVSSASTAAAIRLQRCTLTAPSTFNGALVTAPNLRVDSCVFDNSATTAGVFADVFAPNVNGRVLSVTNCTFTADGGAGATSTAIQVADADSTHTIAFHESGNKMSTDVAILASVYVATGEGSSVTLGSRNGVYKSISRTTNVQVTLDPWVYDTAIVNNTHASDTVIQFEHDLKAPASGCRFVVKVVNGDVAPHDFIFADTNSGSSPYDTVTVGAGEHHVCVIESINSNGGQEWLLASAKRTF